MKIRSIKSKLTAFEKRKILWASMISLFIANMMILNVPSFLPDFAKKNWPNGDVTHGDIAIITGLFAGA